MRPGKRAMVRVMVRIARAALPPRKPFAIDPDLLTNVGDLPVEKQESIALAIQTGRIIVRSSFEETRYTRRQEPRRW